ncbi:conserved protein, unknown function [Plasmodium knowlesi strain H]|uniref:Protein LTV1 homolog n=3 Tax=Plasmodium knowlesi TaxID=5850 RepID=A0A679KW32_PLAKH|nr:conserved protein, unknown function [Plasmodium knowlesi strain H]OTN66881.1 Uncharacterized protein PKNOH_S08502700 [Plasmodium knowlesi]CAA9986704.1 conserved protein, unknown function [Plasmodium knowlesi strain H]SBO25015.1 conserved Plasmodium protein, unknown function [Plasmodium knowlesi strain H]VVS76178.1 conserved protein, unknown function [Plasmodium knowlesi strain H]
MKGRSNGGGGRSGGGCRIKKVTFREPPVVCEFSENEKHEFDEPSCGEDEVNEFFLDDNDLSSLMENFDPTDFGIKEKLTESEKKILIREIYGRRGTNGESSTSVSSKKKNKKSITLREDDPLEEHSGRTAEVTMNSANKQNGGCQRLEHAIDNISETNNKTMEKTMTKQMKKKKKKIKGRRKEEDPMAYLDGDCYFPDDGYDYEQHLKTISPNFVSAKSKAENNFFEVKPTDEEETELFKTFEADNYEELNDNFVYEAQDVSAEDKLDVPKDLIWGTPDWTFPIGDTSAMYFTNDPTQLNQLGESDDGLTTDGGISNAEGEAARMSGNHQLHSGSSDSSSGGDEGERGNPEENGYVIFDEGTHTKMFTCEKKKEKDTNTEKGDPNALKLSDLVKLEMEKVDSKNLNEIKNILVKKKKKKKKNRSTNNTDNTLVHVNVEDKIKILQILNSQTEEESHHRSKGDGDENSRSDASGEIFFSSSDASSSSLSYDCETILTTKTNTTNHPCKLVIPKKVPTPASANTLINPLPHGNANPRRRDKEKEKVGEEAKLESYLVLENINTTRGKNETPEEKRERKKSVKEAQRLNRKLKKENALLMKSEKKLMNKKSNPFDIRDNVKYIKL